MNLLIVPVVVLRVAHPVSIRVVSSDASESNRIEALVSLVSSTQLRCESHLGRCVAYCSPDHGSRVDVSLARNCAVIAIPPTYAGADTSAAAGSPIPPRRKGRRACFVEISARTYHRSLVATYKYTSALDCAPDQWQCGECLSTHVRCTQRQLTPSTAAPEISSPSSVFQPLSSCYSGPVTIAE